jgi:hypothetical protein
MIIQDSAEGKEEMNECHAQIYNSCRGEVISYNFVWHVTPRKKENKEPYTTSLTCKLCSKHYHRIVKLNNNRHPEISGWDEWDALDDLAFRLDY